VIRHFNSLCFYITVYRNTWHNYGRELLFSHLEGATVKKEKNKNLTSNLFMLIYVLFMHICAQLAAC